MLLAESFSPPEGFSLWLTCAVFVLFVWDKILSIRAKSKPQEVSLKPGQPTDVNVKSAPSPLTVEILNRFVTHTEMADVKADIAETERKIDALRTEVHKNHVESISENSKSAKEINARINVLLEAIKLPRAK